MGMGNVVKFDGNFSFHFSCSWENSNHKERQQKSVGNMNKCSNKQQINILLGKMQRNPDMAKGRSKENKKKFDVFWAQLSTELNCAGPPIKSMYEWKKVWIDQKRYVKKKAASAMAAMQAAGGATSAERAFLSVTETFFKRAAMKTSEQLSALEAVGMKQSQIAMAHKQSLQHRTAEARPKIANADRAPALLVPSTESGACATEMLTPHSIIVKRQHRCGAHTDEETRPSNENADCVFELLIPKSETEECASEILNEECQMRAQSANNSNKDNDSRDSISAVDPANRPRTTVESVPVGIPVQKEIYQKINEALENANRNSGDLKVGMKKIHQKLSRLEEQNRLKLEEIKRHNREMEQLRRQEIECEIKKNARLLEIEELKLKLMEFRDRQRDLAY